jgi:hypothetical protein
MNINSACDFTIDASMMQRTVLHMEERTDGLTHAPPFGSRGSRQACQAHVIVRQRRTADPIGTQQVQIRAVLGRRQVRGITPIVAPVERHPTIWFGHGVRARRDSTNRMA